MIAVLTAGAQSPPLVIVQAATPPPTQTTLPVREAGSLGDAIKALQAIKAANAEILSKQTAALQQLDEIHKAAEQIKIFTARQ